MCLKKQPMKRRNSQSLFLKKSSSQWRKRDLKKTLSKLDKKKPLLRPRLMTSPLIDQKKMTLIKLKSTSTNLRKLMRQQPQKMMKSAQSSIKMISMISIQIMILLKTQWSQKSLSLSTQKEKSQKAKDVASWPMPLFKLNKLTI